MATDGSFLGRGWRFPPTFLKEGVDVEMVAGEEDIHESLRVLLSTELGERVMQESFGCDLRGLVFEEVDRHLINRITSTVANAILYHEPRIKMEGLDVSESDAERGVLLIRIDYTVKSTNSRYNMVYPFYLNEASSGLF